MEIVCHCVDDDGPAGNFFYCKPGCDKCSPGDSFVYKDRGQIARMHRVLAIFRVVMASGICKRVFCIAGAGSALMNVQSQYGVLAVAVAIGNAVKRRSYQNGVSDIVKGNGSTQIIIFFRAQDMGDCLGFC